ncbi:type II toxin-antitoxin system Phd/YefM family antitoxin [Acetobacter vaccinii]|uniref:Plasmid stabilization protein n=1 Tax=Acetobacter vaccinii TaxID=2592655 RepID=A0A5C1YSR0_9PROT|nr:plasmid stabilization protein [Acetobacter vaccinii]QEO18853.1 plasmid stabilization protein [Acetobacter vaccinii]
MLHCILTDTIASLSELKRNPIATVSAGGGGAVAILDSNKPVFYCVPNAMFEAMMDKLEDQRLNAVADARSGQSFIHVRLDDL